MTYPRTPTLRSCHARIYCHFRRRVIKVPLHALRGSIGLIAYENCNTSDGLAALMGIFESQLAGAVLFIRCEGERIRGVRGAGGREDVVGVG